MHTKSQHLCKPLWAVCLSSPRWGWATKLSAFCYSLLTRCGCPSGGSAEEHLNSLDFSDCASPLRWALCSLKIIMVLNAKMRCKYKQKRDRDSRIFRQCYLPVIPSPPSRYYFYSCTHFCCEFVSAEIELFKFGSWRAKLADICRTHEDDPGWNCCCAGSVLPSHSIPRPAAKRAPSLRPREDYCLLVGNIILFGM